MLTRLQVFVGLTASGLSSLLREVGQRRRRPVLAVLLARARLVRREHGAPQHPPRALLAPQGRPRGRDEGVLRHAGNAGVDFWPNLCVCDLTL
jgi:hypothetical protein